MACLLTRLRLKQANTLKPVTHTHTHFYRTECDYDWALLINCYGRFMFSFSLTLPPELALKPHNEALNNSTSPLHKKQSKCTIQAHLFIWWREQHTKIQGAHSSSNWDGWTTLIVHQGECVSSHLARDNTKAKPFILHSSWIMRRLYWK